MLEGLLFFQSFILIYIFYESVFILSRGQEKYAQEIKPRLRIINTILESIKLDSPEKGLYFLVSHRILWMSKYRTFSIFHLNKPPESIFLTDDI